VAIVRVDGEGMREIGVRGVFETRVILGRIKRASITDGFLDESCGPFSGLNDMYFFLLDVGHVDEYHRDEQEEVSESGQPAVSDYKSNFVFTCLVFIFV